jgi:hypothetical protein
MESTTGRSLIEPDVRVSRSQLSGRSRLRHAQVTTGESFRRENNPSSRKKPSRPRPGKAIGPLTAAAQISSQLRVKACESK